MAKNGVYFNLIHNEEIADMNGVIKFKVTEGTPPFEYTWSEQKGELNGNGLLNIQNVEIPINDLPTGKYNFKIVDSNYDIIFDGAIEIKANAFIPTTVPVEKPKPEKKSKPISPPKPKKEVIQNTSRPIVNKQNKSKPTHITNTKRSTPNHAIKKSTPSLSSSKNKRYIKTKKLSTAKHKIIQYDKLLFEADSFKIMENHKRKLGRLKGLLAKNDKLQVRITGHTNGNKGIKHDYCDQLSMKRAEAVASYLVSKGIDFDKIICTGHGKREPLRSNYTLSGRTGNQRVEINLIEVDRRIQLE